MAWYDTLADKVSGLFMQRAFKSNATNSSTTCASRTADANEFIDEVMRNNPNIGGINFGFGEHHFMRYRKEPELIDYPGKVVDPNPIKNRPFFLNKPSSIAHAVQALTQMTNFERMMDVAQEQTDIPLALKDVAVDLQQKSWANNQKRRYAERNGIIKPQAGETHGEAMNRLFQAMKKQVNTLIQNDNSDVNYSGRDFVSVKVEARDGRTYIHVFPDFEEEKFMDTLEGASPREVLEAYETHLKDMIEQAGIALDNDPRMIAKVKADYAALQNAGYGEEVSLLEPTS